ncbi:unnamed protein product [Soboliphyme baturini]|uniref:Helitron_like_N domain-containing protein n=1 Tax=Soboliphyme baturini TaxID=241478 RepID=A0A183INT9_9BILA|nr:unnamed protein product [Soboliphyme baturini]
MHLKRLQCAFSLLQDGSSLRCSKHLRYCYGRNIFFDFNLCVSYLLLRYRSDVIRDGDVGGNCILNDNILRERADETGYLQSWAGELIHFASRSDFRMDRKSCDVIFTKPVIIMKLDAGVSMYHHFCDFINLYASQHINGSFDETVPIILWDTSAYGYHDLFSAMWRVFSQEQPIQLKDFDGKRVCFREVMMPLLARMFFGLYYNMPLIRGCHGSGLIHAFSKHVLHRMNIRQIGPLEDKIRITLLSRDSQYRRILNEQKVTLGLNLTLFPLLTILDVFMSVHGSGLTHLLFLPDWAAVVEIYNCGDKDCYKDLARLRGVKYFTWEDESKLTLENSVGTFILW